MEIILKANVPHLGKMLLFSRSFRTVCAKEELDYGNYS